MKEKKRWFAVYTRHRWEKKVFQLLQQNGFETYCPLNKVERKWSDRIKTIEEPLFKSYVFVRVTEEEKTAVRMTNGVINFVYWLGKPAIVKDREIVTIKKFLNEFSSVETEQLELMPNAKVAINSGIFMDKTATILNVSKKKIRVVIDSIGFALIAHVDRSKISRVK